MTSKMEDDFKNGRLPQNERLLRSCFHPYITRGYVEPFIARGHVEPFITCTLLSIDMKTKVFQHVPRINLDNLTS